MSPCNARPFIPPKSKPGEEWFLWPDLSLRWTLDPLPPAELLEEPVYFPFVPARQSAHAEVELRFAKRGSYYKAASGWKPSFPFSF